LYSAREKKVYALSGQGCAPRAMTLDWFRENRIDLIPGDGLLPAMVPAVVGTWTEALARFGTLSFQQVSQPAVDLALEGFPMYPNLHEHLVLNAKHYRNHYPSTLGL